MKNFTVFLIIFSLTSALYVKGQDFLNITAGDFLVTGSVNNSNLDGHISVENTSISDLSVRVLRDNSLLMNGHQSYFCWAQCYDTTVSLSPDPLTIPGRTTDTLSFHGYLYPLGNAGTSHVTYTFYDENNISDSAVATITYEVLSTGINEVENRGTLASASPNPANNLTSIGYSLPTLNNGRLIISNMLGSTVKEFKLTNKQTLLFINTADIPSGVYIYSLMNNGKPVMTKRLVIAHR